MNLHDQLNDFLQKSVESVEDLKKTMESFGGMMSQQIIDAPVEHKQNLQYLKNQSMKIINLAQDGKMEEANQILNKLKNEHQNN